MSEEIHTAGNPNGLSISVEHTSTFSLAAQQNDYPIFKAIRLTWHGFPQEQSTPSVRKVEARLSFDSDVLQGEVWQIDQLEPNQSLKLQTRSTKSSLDLLLKLSDPLLVEAKVEVTSEGKLIGEWVGKIDVLPPNFWGGESRQPDLLAAFVKPNGVYVEELVHLVTQALFKSGHGKSADGYQSGTREKPYLMAAALWNVICSQGLSYVSPPVGFAKQGQRIRLASDISNFKNTACLDTSLLFASCLEHMGLNSVVALTSTHAFAGVWLIDQRFPVLTNDDSMDLRKRIDAQDLLLFETTLVTNDSPVTFSEACSIGRQLMSEDKEVNFVYVIDIAMARARQIRSMSTTEIRAEEKKADAAISIDTPLTTPPLPPVSSEEKSEPGKETPLTRVDMWQRKLLDLTKRNPLLNHSDKALAIKLFCPAIGEMEDMLSDGVGFEFQSADESPINDKGRDEGAFRLNTGNDLHKQYAIDQLRSKVLISNQSSHDLERNAINLLRKAQTDLEEGGSNTLFLTLGYLRWKETPECERSYRAPLILIPVQMSRKSARAKIVLRKSQEDEAIFNLTLIEFLALQHGIDLNEFKDELPEDESGVDVQQVWSKVRHAISDQKGFEVVEELALGSFSFAKYLMWKDLHDRIDDLVENRFVAHLVNHPLEPYQHESSFVSQHDVDRKISPTVVFTPLNCDSSQLVAVHASGKDQDFVLEGPPGTGKSETIANIVAHNLALGRKVLFVAEKMAALNVVYRRLEKIGLDHLCLELHSNKANKRAVLDQLAKSSNRQTSQTASDWKIQAEQLGMLRAQLNRYVIALHEKSDFGISFRECVSRCALNEDDQLLRLTWTSDLKSAPIKDDVGLAEMLGAVRSLALAFHDIEAIDPTVFYPVKAKVWSSGWQSEVVQKLNELRSSCTPLLDAFNKLLTRTQLMLQPSTQNFTALLVLEDLANHVIRRPMKFALGSGAKENIEKLSELIRLKGSLDLLITGLGHQASTEKLLNAPVDVWLTKFESGGRKLLTGWMVRKSINKDLLIAGFDKVSDFTILPRMQEAKNVAQQISPLLPTFETDKVWNGWDTSVDQIELAHESAVTAQRALIELVHTFDDPAGVMSFVNKHFVDGRDYLEGSQLIIEIKNFVSAFKQYQHSLSDLESLGLVIEKEDSPTTIEQNATGLLAAEKKLKSWCEWQSAVENVSRYDIQPVVDSLVGRAIGYQYVEAQTYTAFCRWLAGPLMDKSADLREFKSSTHEDMIRGFRQLDEAVANTTGQYIKAITSGDTPDLNSKECPKEFGVLARELQKKTRHKPIRALLTELGDSLLKLTPCLMMSPMSVAQFLPSTFRSFDLVLFDEASQMTTWDSVGAIARGRNVIVVGDPKQMPPTNFFTSGADSDDPDEEDLESILDQALAARLPHRRLTGHYRSRHETLIAFSNSKYYENSLVSYPSAETKASAVTLMRIDGLYAKGTQRNNIKEAKAVVEEVVRRLSDLKLKKFSIGIVTLNTEQMRTVQDLLDEKRRANPWLEEFFQPNDSREPIFVKNLEAVQGDERDVIMLSLGYGPVEPSARTMSMNFGPLNRVGGERRLNVAITRAKHEMVVFTSFDSSMIDLSRTSAVAVEHLKQYLEFAERGPVALAEQATADHGEDQFDSDFEQSVANSLRKRGWKIQTQVGVTKFRIDLGVQHPDKPGVYLAGVECDGAAYHSSPSARDRDRVRQVILESLGWRLLRLWSTDYFVDPEAAIDRLHIGLTELLNQDKEAEAIKKELNEVVGDACEEAVSRPDEALESVYQESSPMPSTQIYSSDDYFKESHREVLSLLAQSILEEKNGIKLHTLTLDIANRHGQSRTSKKQLELVLSVIEPWAGLKEFPDGELVVWRHPQDVCEVIEWRGLDPFGYERDWPELPYPETVGVGQLAARSSPKDPVNFICNLFGLQRRREKTIAIFQTWVDKGREIGAE